MKTLISILLCLIIVCLCSCGNNAKNDLTTTLSTENNGVQQSMVSDKTQSATEYVTVEIKTSPDEPYSYIIRETYDLVINKLSDPYYYHYAFYDIDGNGTEELLIGEPYVVGGIQNVEPPYETEVMVTEIYSISGGKLIKQEIMSWWMVESILERSILDNGLIKYVSGSQNRQSYLYMKIMDGQMVLLHNLKNQRAGMYYRYLDPKTVSEFKSDKTGTDREYELFLEADKREITPEEFDRLRAEIEGDAKPVEIEWKNIEQYGR